MPEVSDNAVRTASLENQKQDGVSIGQNKLDIAVPNNSNSVVKHYIVPPLQFGLWTGAGGVVAGMAGSIARDSSLYAGGLISGAQWFTLGSTFWFSRILTIKAWGRDEQQLTPFDKVKVSTIAGSTTGALSGALRGPTKILPAVVLWGVIGAGGQVIANRFQVKDKSKNETSFLGSWSPLKKLSDQEYLDMLDDKVLKVEVDIALIDDKIADLRKQEQRAAAAVAATTTTTSPKLEASDVTNKRP